MFGVGFDEGAIEAKVAAVLHEADKLPGPHVRFVSEAERTKALNRAQSRAYDATCRREKKVDGVLSAEGKELAKAAWAQARAAFLRLENVGVRDLD